MQVLEGLKQYVKRPGMYIGSTGPRGLHHLVYEIVDNGIDEALAGFCDKIEVKILPDNIICVIDNGRGIPVGKHPKMGIPAATVVYTVLHAGGKFGGGGYKSFRRFAWFVGASVVNALSEWLEIEIYKDGDIYTQRFRRGNIKTNLEIVGKTEKTGTLVRFKPDAEIFKETTEFDFEILKTRFARTSILNAVFIFKSAMKEIRITLYVKISVMKAESAAL